MGIDLKPNERIDDLQLKGLRIIQNTKKFCFGMDAILLSHFAQVRPGERVVDLGTGTGIIPILLSGKTQAKSIYGLEIQPDMVEMANRSISLNGLEDRVKIITGDLKESSSYFGIGKYQVVISNPPYKKRGTGLINPDDDKAIARHEILCNLEDVLEASSQLLAPGGRVALVHRPDRMIDILYGMREKGLEPKRMRIVYPSKGKSPNLILIERVKGGKPYLKWMPPLIVYGPDGEFTEDIKEIYSGG